MMRERRPKTRALGVWALEAALRTKLFVVGPISYQNCWILVHTAIRKEPPSMRAGQCVRFVPIILAASALSTSATANAIINLTCISLDGKNLHLYTIDTDAMTASAKQANQTYIWNNTYDKQSKNPSDNECHHEATRVVIDGSHIRLVYIGNSVAVGTWATRNGDSLTSYVDWLPCDSKYGYFILTLNMYVRDIDFNSGVLRISRYSKLLENNKPEDNIQGKNGLLELNEDKYYTANIDGRSPAETETWECHNTQPLQ
jgi:hypothetical protein